MSIIDAQGWFHGDRLGRCSDLAQLLWGRFMVATNGYGRLKLDYDDFCREPLASLKKRPSLREISEIFREYQDNFLAFLYFADGQIWAQFECPERYLQRHKTAADKRSPVPDPEKLTAWRDAYADSKAVASAPEFKELLGKFPKSTETSQTFPLGVGVGGGVGGGNGKEKAKALSPRGDSTVHNTLRQLIQETYLAMNPTVPTCPWGGAEGKQLQTLIGKTPRWGIEQYRTCLMNLYDSAGISPSIMPLEIIPKLPKYLNGALDEYGHAKTANKSEQRRNSNLNALDQFRSVVMDRGTTHNSG